MVKTNNNPTFQEVRAQQGLEGFQEGQAGHVVFRGKLYKRVAFEKKVSGIPERIGRLAATGVGIIGTLGFGFLSESFRENAQLGAKGETYRTVYQLADAEDVKNYNERTNAKLGFNPKDKESVRAFLKDVLEFDSVQNEGKFSEAQIEKFRSLRSRIQEVNGHRFLDLDNTQGVSRFIFMPDGDSSKARCFRVYDMKEGVSLKDRAARLRAIKSFCFVHDDVKKEWKGTISHSLATQLNKDRDEEKQFKAKGIKYKTLVIRSTGAVKAFGETNPNARIGMGKWFHLAKMSGTTFTEISDSAKNAVKALYDPEKTDGKFKLDDEKDHVYRGKPAGLHPRHEEENFNAEEMFPVLNNGLDELEEEVDM